MMTVRHPRLSGQFRAVLGLILLALLLDGATLGHPSAYSSRIDVARMELIFSEEFDALDVSANGPGTRWTSHTPWGGDFGDAVFTSPGPDFPFTVRDGLLYIECRKDPDGVWRSGLLSSGDPRGQGFSQLYGYFEMRARLPRGKGLWPAFWLNSVMDPTAEASVEIDVLEAYGQFPDKFNSTVHVWFKNGQPRHYPLHTKTIPINSLYENFNTFGVLVGPEWIQFYFNREEYWRVPTPRELRPSIILLNLALGSGWPIDETPSPSVMVVDYVRVYALEGANDRRR
jgi:hypothetical protein